MPRHDSYLKRDIRARMAATGERYAVARRAVLRTEPEPGVDDWVEHVGAELAATLPIPLPSWADLLAL
jgi:hypothetical protein